MRDTVTIGAAFVGNAGPVRVSSGAACGFDVRCAPLLDHTDEAYERLRAHGQATDGDSLKFGDHSLRERAARFLPDLAHGQKDKVIDPLDFDRTVHQDCAHVIGIADRFDFVFRFHRHLLWQIHRFHRASAAFVKAFKAEASA